MNQDDRLRVSPRLAEQANPYCNPDRGQRSEYSVVQFAVAPALDITLEERVAAGLPRHPETGETGLSRPTKNGEVTSPLPGDRPCDVYLNAVACWKNAPVRVWEYTIGGYQVIKKGLSYRKERLPGRALTKEEARYVQEMARRIAAILLLEPDLNADYQSVKAHAYVWPG